DVAAGSCQAVHQPVCYGIVYVVEDDRYCSSSVFRSARCTRAAGINNGHFEPHQFLSQAGKTLWSIVGVANFTADVLPLEVAKFIQLMPKNRSAKRVPGARAEVAELWDITL